MNESGIAAVRYQFQKSFLRAESPRPSHLAPPATASEAEKLGSHSSGGTSSSESPSSGVYRVPESESRTTAQAANPAYMAGKNSSPNENLSSSCVCNAARSFSLTSKVKPFAIVETADSAMFSGSESFPNASFQTNQLRLAHSSPSSPRNADDLRSSPKSACKLSTRVRRSGSEISSDSLSCARRAEMRLLRLAFSTKSSF